MLNRAVRNLLVSRVPAGHWEGGLSSSALSTATATFALELYRRAAANNADARLADLCRRGGEWIARHQNEDGGWGDTTDSPSNISTTLLCWIALGAGDARSVTEHRGALDRAERWLRERFGDLTAWNLSKGISRVYGRDRTFSVPILTMAALGGRLGHGHVAWHIVRQIPFELAVLPHGWFKWLGLPMVSYALPALIAMGQVRHHHLPTRNPITRFLRFCSRQRTLDVLQSIQPAGGGFLEATPLTSFVTMSLVGCELPDHPVVRQGVEFLTVSVRDDGSWPIDTNLATWVTTLAVNGLATGGRLDEHLSGIEQVRILAWLMGQQYRREHPYTHAAPGGWAWTDLSGGVPDSDDTASALLAIWHLAPKDDRGRVADAGISAAAANGVRWLRDVQNRDGGIPTFCRGWGKLPFDRSSPDLTAHALRAWDRWWPELPDDLKRRVDAAKERAIRYLLATQRSDGSWVPLWFGNQYEKDRTSPLYGTARVLQAGAGIVGDESMRRGVGWILTSQNADGGWGGAREISSTIEETALALDALAGFAREGREDDPELRTAIERGCAWLDDATRIGKRLPAPIGLYFARLWYSERLYPMIFTVSALERVRAAGIAMNEEGRAAGAAHA